MQNKLTGYCIQHVKEYLFFRDDAGTTTADFEQSAAYPSKLAAHQQCAEFFKNVVQLEDSEWRICRRSTVIQRPKPAEPLDAPFKLAISNPLEAVQKVYELHSMYSERVATWLRHVGCKNVPPQAACKMTITAPKWAGIWSPRERECHYPVVYAMMAEDFHVIVAHEVVHSYQCTFYDQDKHNISHGRDFYALMLHAAQEPVSRHTHTYNVGEAKRLSNILLPWWQFAGINGLLQALPVEVVTQPMKRKGIE